MFKSIVKEDKVETYPMLMTDINGVVVLFIEPGVGMVVAVSPLR